MFIYFLSKYLKKCFCGRSNYPASCDKTLEYLPLNIHFLKFHFCPSGGKAFIKSYHMAGIIEIDEAEDVYCSIQISKCFLKGEKRRLGKGQELSDEDIGAEEKNCHLNN